jgi:hypothetical protein
MDLDNKDTVVQYKIECVFTIYSETDSPYHWEIYKKAGDKEWEYLACYRLWQEAEYVLSRIETFQKEIEIEIKKELNHD